MPAFNASAHLVEGLRGIASLLGSDAELVFVDDGSTDGTAGIFLVLQQKLPLANARIIRQDHAGVSVARNTGLLAARGAYVLFLDSDDSVSGDLLAEIQVAVADRSPDIICWGWDTVAATGEVLRRYFDVHPVIPTEMSGVEALFRRTVDRSLRLWTASAAYRRCYLVEKQLTFTPGRSVGEDLEFGYRALLHARSVAFLPRVLSTYRQRSNSVTQSHSVVRFESLLALQRVLSELEADGRTEVDLIADHFRRTKSLVNYFHTLESSLRGLNHRSPCKLLREIDEAYPCMNGEMRSLILGNRAQMPFEWLLFALSTRCWWMWKRTQQYVDRFLPRRLRSTGPFAEVRRARLLAR
ncbi:glycosyltransferase family 2 protein [Streptomyces sp. NPDC047042]|uniref:glycosyltransferase family 2 protein n=1 Tax=Streptomyces sp. NPDC047042 TaxID=3154807 RepID=UPI0033DE6D28